jgi:hypothetical protein
VSSSSAAHDLIFVLAFISFTTVYNLCEYEHLVSLGNPSCWLVRHLNGGRQGNCGGGNGGGDFSWVGAGTVASKTARSSDNRFAKFCVEIVVVPESMSPVFNEKPG